MEVTFDPAEGGAFESRNGRPLDGNVEVVQPDEQPEEIEQPDELELPTEDEHQEPLEEQQTGFTPNQQGAIDFWNERGYDMQSVLGWVDGETSAISDAAYELAAEKFGGSNPEEQGRILGTLAMVHRNQEAFDYEAPEELESLPDHVEQKLVDEMGGEFASAAVNLNYKVVSGEMTYAEAQRYVFDNPALLQQFIEAADKGLLRFSI